MAKGTDIATTLVGTASAAIALGMVFLPLFYVGLVIAIISGVFMLTTNPNKDYQLLPKKKPKPIADSNKIAELEQSLGITYETPQDTIKSGNSKYPDLPQGYRWEFKYNPEQKDYRGNITYWEDYEIIVWDKSNRIHSIMVEPRKHSGVESMGVALDKAIAKCYKKTLEHHSERDMRKTIMNDYKIGG